MKYPKCLIITCGLGLSLLISNIISTGAYYNNREASSDNIFRAGGATLWTQTTENDFNSGLLDNLDIATSPGEVRLAEKSDWYDAAWTFRAPLTIDNPGVELNNFQVKVPLAYDSAMQTGFNDIRFTAADGFSLLPFWAESYAAGVSAIFWVRLPVIPPGASTLFVYFGNATVSSTSDGHATFDFFDDFSGDLSKWDVHIGNNSSINVNYGNPAPCLEISGGSPDGDLGLGIMGSDATFSEFQDGVIEADIFPDTDAVPEIIFRGNYNDNSGYKGRWDTRGGNETPWMTPPYADWGGFGDEVTRFGIVHQWQKAKLVINGSDFEIYSNDILMSAVSNATYPGLGEIGLANHFGPYSRFDNIRVRKYAAQEPEVNLGAPEGLYSPSGTLASQVLDTLSSGTRWDALCWDRTLLGGTNIAFEVRASDTSFAKEGSVPSWEPVGSTSPVISGLPSGQYMQWRATLNTSDASITPDLHEVRLYYR